MLDVTFQGSPNTSMHWVTLRPHLESCPTFTFSFLHLSSNQLHRIVERTYLFLSVTWISSPSAVLRRSDGAGYKGIAARAQGKPRYLCS
jgi:hypothetical protein